MSHKCLLAVLVTHPLPDFLNFHRVSANSEWMVSQCRDRKCALAKDFFSLMNYYMASRWLLHPES